MGKWQITLAAEVNCMCNSSTFYKLCQCALNGIQALLKKGQNVVTCTIAQPRSLIIVWQLSSGNIWCQRTQPCKLWVSCYHLQGLFRVPQPHLVFLDLLSASGWVKSSAVFLPIKDESSNFWHVASKHCLHAWNKNTKKKKKKMACRECSTAAEAAEPLGILTFFH